MNTSVTTPSYLSRDIRSRYQYCIIPTMTYAYSLVYMSCVLLLKFAMNVEVSYIYSNGFTSVSNTLRTTNPFLIKQ